VLVMKTHLDRVLSVILTLAAASIAVAFVHREFAAPSAVRGPAAARTRVKGWTDLLKDGVFIGDTAATVKIVEFGDFECPFCRRADSVFRIVKQKYGAEVALVYVHYPLPMHRFAIPAARAAECAGEQDRFAEMHDALFSKQDSLGLKSWMSFASETAIRDT
jgi:protein-disulfide isomerase